MFINSAKIVVATSTNVKHLKNVLSPSQQISLEDMKKTPEFKKRKEEIRNGKTKIFSFD